MAKYQVQVEKEIKDLIPGFMANRKKDLISIQNYIDAANCDEISKIAHKIKGSSGGYGFHELSKVGAQMEEAAKKKDLDTIKNLFPSMKEMVESVDIQFI
jgi:HPt (histidine-containing phosphotransfer) domain-containing protein